MRYQLLFFGLLVLASCDVDLRPDISEAQFREVIRVCHLSPKTRLELTSDGTPRIVLGADETDAQAECIRAENDRLGVSSDMAQ